jgi:hypothetical protein
MIRHIIVASLLAEKIVDAHIHRLVGFIWLSEDVAAGQGGSRNYSTRVAHFKDRRHSFYDIRSTGWFHG